MQIFAIKFTTTNQFFDFNTGKHHKTTILPELFVNVPRVGQTQLFDVEPAWADAKINQAVIDVFWIVTEFNFLKRCLAEFHGSALLKNLDSSSR